MATKNLSVRDEVYRKLVEAKREGESFSDVIERLIGRRSSLLTVWGALADSPNLADIEREVRKVREKTVVRKKPLRLQRRTQ